MPREALSAAVILSDKTRPLEVKGIEVRSARSTNRITAIQSEAESRSVRVWRNHESLERKAHWNLRGVRRRSRICELDLLLKGYTQTPSKPTEGTPTHTQPGGTQGNPTGSQSVTQNDQTMYKGVPSRVIPRQTQRIM